MTNFSVSHSQLLHSLLPVLPVNSNKEFIFLSNISLGNQLIIVYQTILFGKAKLTQ